MPGLSVPTVTPAQMASVDRIMAEDLGIDTLQLMELAGQAVAAWTRHLLGDVHEKRVLILAGRGGNGGDGMVAARLLHGWGARPEVWLSHEASTFRGATAHQAAALVALGIPVTPPVATGSLSLPAADLLVDALLGFGLRGGPVATAAALIRAANTHPAPVLAVDLPSGLDAGSGEPYAPCIVAAATLTLALPKSGLFAPTAAPFVGELSVADIGIPPEVYARVGVAVPPLFHRESIILIEATRR